MSQVKAATPVKRDPMDATWPSRELETLGACPVCGARARGLAYKDLQDRVFFCAPGAWTAWTCALCHVAYVDPRPTLESIHAAYNSYYTHDVPSASFTGELLTKLQIGIRHSYLNKRLGYRLPRALPFGWLVYKALRPQAIVTNHTIRHLPPPRSGENRLLDIGCGDGEFLIIARDIGFDVQGLEVDPVSRAVAQKAGLTVHPGPFPGSTLEPNSYDHVTMSHVLEHFHDPAAALQEAFNLLKPGGRIWVKVPNLAALSHEHFKKNAFLLDPPRHLVMFDGVSLTALLSKIGFAGTTAMPPSLLDQKNFYGGGWMTSQGYDPMSASPLDVPVKAEVLKTYAQASVSFNDAEVVTIIATKPA